MISLLKKKEEQRAVSDNPEIAAMLKKKKKKKKITIAVAVVAVAVIGIKFLIPKDIKIPVSTYTVSRGVLENKISLSGTVRSENSRKVYNTISDEVLKVHVKLGDKVKKGDLLAEISSENTADSIAKQKAAMSISSQSNALRLYDAEKKLSEAKSDISVGTYEDIERMNDSVQSAAQRLASARRAYKDVYDNLDIDKNEDEMRLKERSMVTARLAMENRAKELQKQGISPSQDKDYLEKRDAYEKAREEWIRMYNLYVDGLSAPGNAVQSALLDYDNAMRQKERLTINVDRNLDTLENNVKSAQIAADATVDTITLKGLMDDLDNCKITSPIDGIVTAIYVKEGDRAGNLLFVIDDYDNLVIDGVLRDFDVAKVQAKMPVAIKSDVIGEKEVSGTILNVATAATKDINGNIKDGTPEFETTVKVTEPNSGLLVGTSARMKIITQKKEDVLSVPFDAVISDAEGNSVVFLAVPEKDKYKVKKVIVKTGMETDFDLEITDDSIKEGDLIILSPETVTEGAMVVLNTPLGGK